MPFTHNGTEYLNTKEAAKYVGVSYATVVGLIKQHNLKAISVLGKGQAKFYLKSDLDTIPRMKPVETVR